MAYLGSQPSRGQWRKLTDISSLFNGSTSSFTLSVPPGGSQYLVTPGNANQLIISLNNVIKNPGIDYTVNGSTITFSSAPTGGTTFFGILAGDALNIGVPGDGTVTTTKLSTTGVLPNQTLVLNSSGTAWTLGYALTTDTAQNTTSGSTVGFTTVPSTAKSIIFAFQSVSISGSAGHPQIRLGTSSGYVSTGYVAACENNSSTTGFTIGSSAPSPSATYSGVLIFYKLSGNLWTATGSVATGSRAYAIAGHIDAGGTVDRISINSISPDTFDAGSVNISYQG